MNLKGCVKNLRELKQVTPDDYRFLFDLLLERTREQSISHRTMPPFLEHVSFWNNQPYKEAYIITEDSYARGLIYLTERDEVGIFISKAYTQLGLGAFAFRALKEKHPLKRFLANINPLNQGSIDFFTRQGFVRIQNTYELAPF